MARLGDGSIASITGADTATDDLFLVHKIDATTPIKEREITREELALAMVEERLVRANEDGHIVGPIIISTYANAAAAGVLPNGTLAKVGESLTLHDNATLGGVPVGVPSFKKIEINANGGSTGVEVPDLVDYPGTLVIVVTGYTGSPERIISDATTATPIKGRRIIVMSSALMPASVTWLFSAPGEKICDRSALDAAYTGVYGYGIGYYPHDAEDKTFLVDIECLGFNGPAGVWMENAARNALAHTS